MEYRLLGNSVLKVHVLSYGTGTFGGTNEFFKKWGTSGVAEAKRLIDVCLENGVNFFDTADIYSDGESENILGQALSGRRYQTIISTKATFAVGAGPNDKGSSRFHLIRACEASLKRLRTDYIDLYFMHGFDALTPVEETLRALDDLISSGKVRYIGCSNFSGWHLMKSLAMSEKKQLKINLESTDWKLSTEHIARLDRVSHRTPIYPYWHQTGFDERNPKPTTW